nr:MAG TPA: hypothetical protein [Caudoviricetes sp.]
MVEPIIQKLISSFITFVVNLLYSVNRQKPTTNSVNQQNLSVFYK